MIASPTISLESTHRIPMKRLPFLLLALACLLLPSRMFAQINVGLGYQQGFFFMPNADKPIDRFNGNGFLYNNMGHFRWPGGEIYSASLRHNGLLLELNLNTKRSRVSAESFSGNDLFRRDIRFSMQGLSLGVGYAAVEQDDFVLYPAAAIDLGYMKMTTRLGPKANIGQVNYQQFDRNGMVALSIYLKMVFRQNAESITSWSLSPYFYYPLKQYDFFVLNQVLLAPSDWYLDGSTLPARPWNVGVALQFDIDLLRFLQ